MEGTRINKFLSEAGVCSRREGDRLLEKGCITIDGVVAKVGDRVFEGQEVAVNGKAVTKEESYEFYVMDGTKEVFLGKSQAKYLSSEVAGGFTGVVMGLYAVDEQENWAEFRNFCWKQGR